MRAKLLWVSHKLWLCVAAVVISVALLLSAARLITPVLATYKDDVASWASEKLHLKVNINSVSATWYRLAPMFKMHQVAILNNETQVLSVEDIYVGLDWWQSLLHWELTPGTLIISGARVQLSEDQQHHYHLAGISSLPLKASQTRGIDLKKMKKWFSLQKRLELQDIDVDITRYHDKTEQGQLNLSLTNHRNKHKFRGTFMFTKPEPAQIKFVAQLKSKQENSLSHLRGKVYLDINNIVLGQWLKGYELKNIQVDGGRSHIQIWGQLHHGRLTRIQSQFDLKSVGLKDTQSKQVLKIDQAQGELHWLHSINGWQLHGENLNLKINQQQWPTTVFDLHVNHNQQPSHYQLKLDKINLDNINSLIKYPRFGQEKLQIKLADLKPRGQLQQVDLSFYGKQFNFETKFVDFAINKTESTPGVTHVSGQLHLTPSGGLLQLDSQAGNIHFNSLFRKPLAFKQLTGDISWHQNNHTWYIQSEGVTLGVDKGQVSSHFIIILPNDDSGPEVNIQANLAINNTNRDDVYTYMPVGIIPTPLVTWLDSSVLGAASLHASMNLQGKIHDFPFDDGKGEFRIEGQFTDAGLHFYEGWPSAKHLDGHLLFLGRSMKVQVNNGNIDGNHITDLNASIPYMGTAKPVTLWINAKGEGDIAYGLDFIHHSPLEPTIGSHLAGLTGQGPADMSLKLVIPIAEHPPGATVGVNSHVNFNGGELSYPQYKLNLKQLTGRLAFNEHGIQNSLLKAQVFDSPTQIELSPIMRDTNIIGTNIALSGKASIAALADNYQLPLSNWLGGEVPYNVNWDIRNHDNTLTLRSDLYGLSSQLPAPLTKKLLDKNPSTVKIQFANGGVENIKFKIDKIMNAYLRFKQQSNQLYGANIVFGQGQATKPEKSDVSVKGYLSNFSLKAWEDIIKTHKSSKQTNLKLRDFDVKFWQLDAFGYYFNKTQVQIFPPGEHTNKYWHVALDGENINGNIDIPSDYQHTSNTPWTLNFKALAFIPSESNNQKKLQLDPTKIPSLHFVCEQCEYKNLSLGKLDLNLHKIKNGINIDKLSIDGPNIVLNLHGDWKNHEDNLPYSRLQGDIKSKNLENTMAIFGLDPSIHGKKGSLKFNVGWQGDVYSPQPSKMTGTASFRLSEGSISGLSQSSDNKLKLGRALNILSIDSIPRRAQLDFNDLTHKGFYFDQAAGDFILSDGNAKTSDTYVDGTVAYVGVSGNIDLASQTLNLKMSVEPRVTSSLPVVATIAAGPVAGVVTYVVDKAVSSEVGKLTGDYYAVTGPWQKPEVKTLKRP